MDQLKLPFAAPQDYVRADFIEAPSNAAARLWLAVPGRWANGRLVLWGAAGCGKSHLLHVWAAETGAVLVPGAALEVFEPVAPLAIDDAGTADEAVLLHVLNHAAAAGQPVLLAARQAPGRVAYRLADLASRLRASLVVAIEPPDEALLRVLLARLAAARQLRLQPQMVRFLLTRLPPAPAAFIEAVRRLEGAGEAQRLTLTRAGVLLRDLILSEDEPEVSPTLHSPNSPVLL